MLQPSLWNLIGNQRSFACDETLPAFSARAGNEIAAMAPVSAHRFATNANMNTQLLRRFRNSVAHLLSGRVVALLMAMAGFSGFDQAKGEFTAVSPMISARGEFPATLLSDGRVLVTGGYARGGLATAEVFNPVSGIWNPVTNMETRRWRHTATVLTNGLILVVGGHDGNQTLTTALLFNPTTGAWTPTGSMAAPRGSHTATLLQDGRVLVVGGQITHQGSVRLASAEIYSPSIGTWSAAANMGVARDVHTATRLADGTVLVTGGNNGGGVLAKTEVFDPNTGGWTPVGNMIRGRHYHAAVLLPSGKVMVVAGSNDSEIFNQTEYFDPLTKAWSEGPALNQGRYSPSANLLPSGDLLVSGGSSVGGARNTAEVFNDASRTWTLHTMRSARTAHGATLLADGRVLIMGGLDGVISAEIFDPSRSSWAQTGPLIQGRRIHRATLLPSGKVMVIGGFAGHGVQAPTEIYDVATGVWTRGGNPVETRQFGDAYATSTLLPDGRVLVSGGINHGGVLNSSEVYDEKVNQWISVASMNARRTGPSTTLLADGRVLMAAGHDETSPIATAEIYDPVSNIWSVTGSLSTDRVSAESVLLPSGKVLVAGGWKTDSVLASAELFDPTTGRWTLTSNPMSKGRYYFTLRMLPDGRVMAIGGDDNHGGGGMKNVDIYDPKSDRWTQTSSLNVGRREHQATVLQNGKVLVGGGQQYPSASFNSVEVYDITTGTWTLVPSMPTGRGSFSQTLLMDGRVLAVGGGDGFITGSELYDAGLGFDTAWRPKVLAYPKQLILGDGLTLTGNGFRGVSGGSTGNMSDSPTDYPVVQLRSLEGGQILSLTPVRWSSSLFESKPITGFPAGWAMLTIVANGIPSTAVMVQVVLVPVSLTQQPQSVVGVEGETVQLSVTATGSPTPTYQWFKAGNAVPGGTNAALTLANVRPAMIGDYTAVVSNAAGSVTSSVASLSIKGVDSGIWKGLVAYYPFNGNANDESGNGNNGTIYGATLTSDRFGNVGKAYSFLNNYILVPSSNLFNSNDLSVSMWISSSSTQSQVPFIRLTYSDASNEHFGFTLNFYHQSGVEFVAKYNNPSCAPGSGWERNEKIQNILDSNFHHIVGTIIGNTMNLYIDGILSNTITTPYSQTSSCWNGDIQIGRNWSNFTDYFIGKIDDIRFYNRALSQSEVTYLSTH